MTTASSPLRYPGGKQILCNLLAHLIKLNGLEGKTYAEPYAGGAGAALSLLYSGYVNRIMINDADVHVFAFWHAVLNNNRKFVELVNSTEVCVKEWRAQREIYQHPGRHSLLRVGFATFYLNRCNRSGIIANGGIIGGKEQRGEWGIDARFNKPELTARIERLADYRHAIQISNCDGMEFLSELKESGLRRDNCFVYLDPPYYNKGSKLYLSYYRHDDHKELAKFLGAGRDLTWVLTYDNAVAIRRFYRKRRQFTFSLGYSARKVRSGREVLILGSGVSAPAHWKATVPSMWISASSRAARAV